MAAVQSIDEDPQTIADRRRLDEKCRYKYVLDRILALLALPALAIVALLAVVLQTMETLRNGNARGPLLYREERWTQGRAFWILKFRTTFVNSQVPGETGKVTWAGFILKKWYLDEVPQILNILRGDMTLVGPRPNVPWKAKSEILQEGMRSKLLLRAGLTGVVQVFKREARNRNVYADLEQLYLNEVMRRTAIGVVAYDISIMLQTVVMMLRGEGL